MSDDLPSGVYATDDAGKPVQVHLYQTGLYDLGDIAALWQLGELETLEHGHRLTLTGLHLRELETLAHAYSFDCAEGFIEMCLELRRHAAARGITRPDSAITFTSNFTREDDPGW